MRKFVEETPELADLMRPRG